MKRLLIGLLFTISMGSLAMEETEDKAYESDDILDPFAQASYNFFKRVEKGDIGKKVNFCHNEQHVIKNQASMILYFINEKCKTRDIFKFGKIHNGMMCSTLGTLHTEFRAKEDPECLEALGNMYEFLQSFYKKSDRLNYGDYKLLNKIGLLKYKSKNPQESFAPSMKFDDYKILDEEESK